MPSLWKVGQAFVCAAHTAAARRVTRVVCYSARSFKDRGRSLNRVQNHVRRPEKRIQVSANGFFYPELKKSQFFGPNYYCHIHNQFFLATDQDLGPQTSVAVTPHCARLLVIWYNWL